MLPCLDFQAAVYEMYNLYSGAGEANGFGHSLSTVSQVGAADMDETSGGRGETKTVQSSIQVSALVDCCHGFNGAESKSPCGCSCPRASASVHHSLKPGQRLQQNLVEMLWQLHGQSVAPPQLCGSVGDCRVAKQPLAQSFACMVKWQLSLVTREQNLSNESMSRGLSALHVDMSASRSRITLCVNGPVLPLGGFPNAIAPTLHPS